MALSHMRKPFLVLAALLPLLSMSSRSDTLAARAMSEDPSLGPHARDERLHLHDRLQLTPAHTPTIPRGSIRSEEAGVGAAATTSVAAGSLTREVFGFAPYWQLSNNGHWRYSLLSTVAYFGLDVKANGSFDTSSTNGGWQGWNSQQLVTVINGAHAAGDRVVLVIKQFDEATICSIVLSATNTQNAITNTINAMASKNLDGVNVDFEGSSSPGCQNGSIQSGFTNFMTQLSSQVHQRFPSAEVSVDTYSGAASTDTSIFKIDSLAPVVDAIFIMAYDMVFSNTPGHAGPNAPLKGWTYNDTTSVSQYLVKAPASKLLLGVPYYGYKWSTTGSGPYSTTKGGAMGDPYAQVLDDFSCAPNQSHSWDGTGQSPWASWFSPETNDPCGGNYNSWRELYYDDAGSLSLKYDLVNSRNLRGTGMWALGYDGASDDLWRMLAARFQPGTSVFYFAEGFTGSGFNESLSLLMPNQSGTATIDYYTASGHSTQTLAMIQGRVTTVDVNAAVGPNQQVAARVSFPGPGLAARRLRFNTGAWNGATGKIGVSAPAQEWDFAEGSTSPGFNEYVSLENFNSVDVTTHLQYFTDSGAHPLKTLILPARSRTTVEVFRGDLTDNPACLPAGAAANCGVGRGIGGVALQVRSDLLPIVAERPFYVNGLDFGSGPVRDGHDAFGVNGAATQWNFAEGTTLNGFNEYLTLQNPQPTSTSVSITYSDDKGHTSSKSLTMQPRSRFTIPVFQNAYGVGAGVGGVSAQVNASQPIVAERPMYMVHDFGAGPVRGADVTPGATGLAKLYEFPAASTASGYSSFLTILNPNSVPTIVTVIYGTSGGPIGRSFVVSGSTRHTVELGNAAEGPGPGYTSFSILVVSQRPVLVEQPSYSANAASYGATVVMGYQPTSF
jgi:spore germination protein YaaH